MGFNRRDLLKLFGAGAVTAATTGCALHTEISSEPTEPECSGPCQCQPEPEPEPEPEPPKPLVSNTLRGGGRLELDGEHITFRNRDGEEVVIRIGEGNITYTEHCNYEYLYDRRGDVLVRRELDEQPIDVVMDFTYESVRWTPPVPDSNENYLNIVRNAKPGELDVVVCIDDHEVTLNGFMYDSMEYDFSGATIYIIGRCMGL